MSIRAVRPPLRLALILFPFVLFTLLFSNLAQAHAQSSGTVTLGTIAVPAGYLEVEIVQAFERQTGLKVDVVTFSGAEFTDKILGMFAAGNVPDVIWNDGQRNGLFIARGITRSLSPFIAADPTFSVDEFFIGSLRLFRGSDGELYGIPRGNQPMVMYLNLTAISESGLALPRPTWTWEGEFLDLARKLTIRRSGEEDPARWGFQFLTGSPWWWPLLWSYGGSLLNESETAYTMNAPEARDAFEFAAALGATHDVASPRPLVDGLYPNFARGRFGMMAQVAGAAAWLTANGAHIDWDVVELPSGPAGKASWINGAGYSLTSQAENPQLAWELIKSLTSHEGITLITRASSVGEVVPTRRSVFFSEDFLYASPPPANRTAFLEALSYVRPHFVGGERWPEIEAIVTPAITRILLGEAPATQVLESIAEPINAVLTGAR